MSRSVTPLVIGIGNPVRRDDGVGWRLAMEWEQRHRRRPSARLLAVQQVLPELAATLAQHRRVLFIDAVICRDHAPDGSAIDAGREGWAHGPWLLPLQPQPRLSRATPFSHSLEPVELLSLSAALYGQAPAAQRLLLQGRRLDHGNGYSLALRRQLPAARALLQQWLEAGDA